MQSLMKYFGEQGATHPDKLAWPGTASGFPVVGDPGNLKRSEFEDIEHAAYYQFRIFDIIEDEGDRKEFVQIMDRIQNGFFFLVYIDREYVDADGKRKRRHRHPSSAPSRC